MDNTIYSLDHLKGGKKRRTRRKRGKGNCGSKCNTLYNKATLPKATTPPEIPLARKASEVTPDLKSWAEKHPTAEAVYVNNNAPFAVRVDKHGNPVGGTKGRIRRRKKLSKRKTLKKKKHSRKTKKNRKSNTKKRVRRTRRIRGGYGRKDAKIERPTLSRNNYYQRPYSPSGSDADEHEHIDEEDIRQIIGERRVVDGQAPALQALYDNTYRIQRSNAINTLRHQNLTPTIPHGSASSTAPPSPQNVESDDELEGEDDSI